MKELGSNLLEIMKEALVWICVHLFQGPPFQVIQTPEAQKYYYNLLCFSVKSFKKRISIGARQNL